MAATTFVTFFFFFEGGKTLNFLLDGCAIGLVLCAFLLGYHGVKQHRKAWVAGYAVILGVAQGY